MAGYSKCLWQCPPFSHPICSISLPRPRGILPNGSVTVFRSLCKYSVTRVIHTSHTNSNWPLSVIIFNTVMNTLIDTLKMRSELGFNLPKSSHKLNLLQVADDSCLIAKDSSACQSLLNVVERWLQWAGMRAKVSKCHSVAIDA